MSEGKHFVLSLRKKNKNPFLRNKLVKRMIGSALMKLLLLVCKLMNFLPVRCHVFFVLLLKISAETVYLSGSSYRNILRGHLHTSVSQKSVAELSII